MEIVDGVGFLPNFGNVTIVDTDDGVVLVDTGSQLSASSVYDSVRTFSPRRLHTAIFTHGHIDHVFGVGRFDDVARENGWPAPVVIAHENLPRRFDRYRATAGYNEVVNRRQFGLDSFRWPTTYRYPDLTYRDQYEFTVGETTFLLRHERGETDDHTVTWIPSKSVLCSGDLFIWASPNAGNPQKVQRYPLEWAQALRTMADLGATYLLPGHGLPIRGTQRIHEALSDTAAYLESLVEQTVALMNEGARLSDIVATVSPPAELASRPFLRASYDEPEFIVHNIWRLYGGWWDGNPATLKPAPERAVARELADLAGGAAALAERASALANGGSDEELRLAGHLIELAWLADGTDPAIAAARQSIFTVRAHAATSTMARGVFTWAARDAVNAVPPS